jgi:hypothetical protein
MRRFGVTSAEKKKVDNKGENMSKFTAGKWRWELNLKSKRVSLCGGKKPFDLIVMDFERWGMGSAIPRFRTGTEEQNIMKKAFEFAAIVPGREHHKDWFQAIDHPDARLIAAAPEAYELLKGIAYPFLSGITRDLLIVEVIKLLDRIDG